MCVGYDIKLYLCPVVNHVLTFLFLKPQPVPELRLKIVITYICKIVQWMERLKVKRVIVLLLYNQ